MGDLFHTLVYLPIYNVLVFFVNVVPGGDLGLAVVGATLVVKFVLLPLSLSAAKTQREMKIIQPEMKALQEKYKDDKEAQARAMLALYKEHGVKPFSSILMLFIQLPVMFGLFFVAQHAAQTIQAEHLYSFVAMPSTISPLFLGIFSVASSSVILALLTAATQFAYAWYAVPIPEKTSSTGEASMGEEFGRSMALSMRTIFPLLIGVFAYTSGALALYITTGNIFMLAQEFFTRLQGKSLKK
ncbi:MAG: YidC/Oxa1 family membrane protein insertase [Minisyncoccia bacterium]